MADVIGPVAPVGQPGLLDKLLESVKVKGAELDKWAGGVSEQVDQVMPPVIQGTPYTPAKPPAIGPQLRSDTPGMRSQAGGVEKGVELMQRLMGHITDLGAGVGAGTAGAVVGMRNKAMLNRMRKGVGVTSGKGQVIGPTAPVTQVTQTAKPAPATLKPGLKGEPGYSYHATNAENLAEIEASGRLNTFKPSHGTDQRAWPDGIVEKRAYFMKSPENSWQFAPEGGKPVIIRTKQALETEKGTGDLYSRVPIRAQDLEYLGDNGTWHPVGQVPMTQTHTREPEGYQPGISAVTGKPIVPRFSPEVKRDMNKGKGVSKDK